MKAWAALVTFLCVNSRRLGKRSPQDVQAPDGYLPSQEDEFQDDLAGYSANESDLPAYSSAENEVPGLISLPDLVKSKRNATGEESYIDDIKRNNLDLQISNEMEETTTDSESSYETTEFIEIEDDELIRYNAGADDLIESQVEPGIEFDQPMLSVENEKDETTTAQPEFDATDSPADDLEGSGDALQSDLKTGYGSPAKENNNNENILEKDYNAIITENIENGSGDPLLESGDSQLESDTPPIEKLRDDAHGVDRAQQEGDADTDHLEETKENEDEETDKDKEQDENKNEAPMETTQIPQIMSDPKKETEKDDDQLTSSDENILFNISNFSSLSTSIQTCPGGSITVCVSVCPGTSAKIYGACVQGCAERCEPQDPR